VFLRLNKLLYFFQIKYVIKVKLLIYKMKEYKIYIRFYIKQILMHIII